MGLGRSEGMMVIGFWKWGIGFWRKLGLVIEGKLQRKPWLMDLGKMKNRIRFLVRDKRW